MTFKGTTQNELVFFVAERKMRRLVHSQLKVQCDKATASGEVTDRNQLKIPLKNQGSL